MEIRDTREKMNIPPAGIELNEELIIVSKLSEGGSSYTYRAKKKDSEYVILKEYYPLDRAIYIRDKDGFLKYKDSLDESQRAEESRFRDAWMSGELEIANIAFREEKSNSDCSFGHHLVKLESEKTDSAFIEIGTVNGEPLDEWCKVIWARAAGEKEKRKELIEMLQKICSVVESFHKKGIIHCDLKPQNIYITEHKSVFILDFATSIYREKNEIKACGPELGGISEGYSSMSIRDLSTSLDNITRINEADDIYSIIQILFYMLFGKTVEQITDDCSDKNFDELVEELVGSHLEAQHLLLICMLLDDKKRLNMSNIQRCLEDLQHTEAMLADEKTHFLSELVKPGTFHNLRSLLVLIGKITCAVKDSKPYGKRFLLDSRDILVKGSLESDYTVAVASIKAIPGLDGAVPDEKENVRKIRLLLRGFIKNSEDSGKPIRGGINCVGRRKLAKLLDDENFLNYDEFNNAIEELKNYSDPELTYFETNAEEQSIQQRFVLMRGDWNGVIKGGHFYTNNYSAFINQLIEQLQEDENGIICVLKYDDNIDEMLERIPMTIPYGYYGAMPSVSNNLRMEEDDNLYIIIWGIKEYEEKINEYEEKKEKIYNFLSGNNGRLNYNQSKKVKYIYVEEIDSNSGNAYVYENTDIEEIGLNDTFSILKCIKNQNLYGISYDGIKYAIESIGKDGVIIDKLICKQYLMLICGQIYISSRVALELEKYEQSDFEYQSLDLLERIFQCIVSKSAYNYNDELTMLGIFKGYDIKLEVAQIKSLVSNVRDGFLFINMTDVIICNAYEACKITGENNIIQLGMDDCDEFDRIIEGNPDGEFSKARDRLNYILSTEVNGCEEELDNLLYSGKYNHCSSSYMEELEKIIDKVWKTKNTIIKIFRDELDKIMNTKKMKDKRIVLLIDAISRLVFNNYNGRSLFPINFWDECKVYKGELEAYDYIYEKNTDETRKYLFDYIKTILDDNDTDTNIDEKLFKAYVYIILSRFKLKKNGLIENNTFNKENYDLLVKYLEGMYGCNLPVLEVLKLVYYSWKELNSDKLFYVILSKSSSKFGLIDKMLYSVSLGWNNWYMFLSKSDLKVTFYNYVIEKSHYLDYTMNMPIDSRILCIFRIMPVAQMKDLKILDNLLSVAEMNIYKIMENELDNFYENYRIDSPDYIITKEFEEKNIYYILNNFMSLFAADLLFATNRYKRSLEYYTNICGDNSWDKMRGLVGIPYINNYKYNIKEMQLYINFMINECNKILQMQEIVNIIGPDRFDIDNLDRENFVRQGKALVDEIHELVLHRGYGYIDSTIISFITMYKLMQYLYELDDISTYEKYYNLLSDKIEYCRDNYRDCIVYDKGKFIRLTEQQMTDYMAAIEKYRSHNKSERNGYTKLAALKKIIDKIGSDKFNMDNLDREDFVDSGKALVEEINKLALQEGYSDNDSTIISFMTMYELMRYLYELDDRATYEKYYALLSGKIKYHKKISSDCIVYYKGRFVILTYSEMTDYMINIEKYRKKFDED